MGRLWCEGLATLPAVPRRDQAQAVTLVVPYYENPDFLARQLATWSRYPPAVRDALSVIVVDDGSPVPAVLPPQTPGVAVRLFRIVDDIRWNWLAARNIGAHHALTTWILLTDMDHVVPADTLDALVHSDLNTNAVYVFGRREHTGARIAPHSASFFLTRDTFWRIGGYDETLSGHYGTDGDWRRRVAQVAAIQILPVDLVRHEYVGDSSTIRYGRKQAQDARVRSLVARRPKVGWRPKTLSFPYYEVPR